MSGKTEEKSGRRYSEREREEGKTKDGSNEPTKEEGGSRKSYSTSRDEARKEKTEEASRKMKHRTLRKIAFKEKNREGSKAGNQLT